MIKRILVALGATSQTEAAIRLGLEIAVRREAEITGVTLVHAQRTSVDAEPPESGILVRSQFAEAQDVERRFERCLEEFQHAAEAAGVRHRTVRETAEPFTKFLDLARFHDLMICGLKKLLRYEFASEKPVDLLLRFMAAGVQPVLSVGESDRPVRKALIAFSGSAESTRAMKRFVQMNLFPGIRHRVVTFGRPEQADPLAAAAMDYCRAHGCDVEARTIAADPQEALLPEAEAYGADVIVLGNSARKTFMRRMLGDTATHIIAGARSHLFVCQ